jgi:hypothetical protein
MSKSKKQSKKQLLSKKIINPPIMNVATSGVIKSITIFNPPINVQPGDKIVSMLILREVEALCRILQYEYINYEDREAHEVVNKLFKIKKEYERDLDRQNSQVKK